MKVLRLYALLGLALAVTGLAFWLSSQRTLTRDPDYGTPVLPGLAASLDTVTRIRIVSAGNHARVTLERHEGRWIVAEVGYRADAQRVRRLLTALGELHAIDAKTRDAGRYSELGVEDVAAATARSLRVELDGTTRTTAILVGRAAGVAGNYVRVAGTAQALEARPRLDLAGPAQAWLATEILDLSPSRIQSVDLHETDRSPWRLERATRDALHFALSPLIAGRELTHAGAADAPASALTHLQFEAVAPAVTATDGPPRRRALVRTFDGLVVEIQGLERGSERWIRILASFDPDVTARFPPGAGDQAPGPEQVRGEVARLSTNARGWEYKLATDRYDAIFLHPDDLLRH